MTELGSVQGKVTGEWGLSLKNESDILSEPITGSSGNIYPDRAPEQKDTGDLVITHQYSDSHNS